MIVDPGAAKLCAHLPYRVANVEIDEVGQAAFAVRVVTDRQGPTPGVHLVRVEVTDPGGNPVDYYAQNVVLRDGTARVHIPLALDDPPGQ